MEQSEKSQPMTKFTVMSTNPYIVKIKAGFEIFELYKISFRVDSNENKDLGLK